MAQNFQHLSLVTLFLTASLSAHGGQYRGPAASQLIPTPVLVPGRLPPGIGPRVTPTPAPTTGARDLVAYSRTWQTWWEFNKEPYLSSRIQGISPPVTGSDDFYLGQRRGKPRIDVLQATKQDRQERIVPALIKLLEKDRNRDIQSASVIALGKVGVDGAGIQLEKVIAERISRDDQEVRESAVLALGIIGRRESFPILADLLIDGKVARKLAGREKVRKRTRAYAAYGLGLLARRVADPALSQQVHDLLWQTLQDKSLKDRDLRTAIINGLGVMRSDTKRSADKRLAWQTVEELLEWFGQDLGVTSESVQAHAAVAIGRLLGRGDTSLHGRCKEVFSKTLNAKKRRGNSILQSSAIALGMLTMPEEANIDDEVYSEALRYCWQKGRDQTARQLSVMALGRIGGKANKEWLAKAYTRGNKSSERPWLALSLGLLTEPAAAKGKPDEFIGDMLLKDLLSASTDENRSALAIAVGLNGHTEAAPKMLRMLRDHESDSRTAGYLCIGLGLLRDEGATQMLTEVMQRSTRRPFLLQQAAVGLGCLGDRNANERLLQLIQETDSVAVLAAIASAISRIGDRRAIDSLIKLSEDRSMSKLGRAFVAAALGGVGDKDELPWNVPLSVDTNYATGMDTLTNGSTGVLDIL
ncbi:MAG: HEAT repeat protein [Planctomycetota bacterium]|jgi:HEAT repeat protein